MKKLFDLKVQHLSRNQMRNITGGTTVPVEHPCVTQYGCSEMNSNGNTYPYVGIICCDVVNGKLVPNGKTCTRTTFGAGCM